MADERELITKFISFGLNEKEAQLYLHLLKYGPKPPSLLAKSLKTYREHVYRTLRNLIDTWSIPHSNRAVYAASSRLKIALETAVKKHETEPGEIEKRKQEIQELSKQQRFSPSDEFPRLKFLKALGKL